jgi:sirohydrochlorin ferrochelatase
MELAEPSIGQAFDQAVADGADSITIFPYFLAPGRHSRQDVPNLCAEAAKRHPEVHWHCAGPIGTDPHLADLVIDRVNQCERNNYECENCPDVHICKLKSESEGC